MVSCAAASMLRAIPEVAAFCCSTTVATAAEISLSEPMVVFIVSMARTASPLELRIASIWRWISSVASEVWWASALTSWATTAKPLLE